MGCCQHVVFSLAPSSGTVGGVQIVARVRLFQSSDVNAVRYACNGKLRRPWLYTMDASWRSPATMVAPCTASACVTVVHELRLG